MNRTTTLRHAGLTLAAGLLTLGTAATADQVILDDLIVDGSACIGQDCVNGESFGFDTIRIKENNLRIKAQDTSSTASFPSNDWQITFNESSNGGANKFSIDDIDGGRTPFTIEASAPSHSLYVDDGGRIGFGTGNPVVELHVKDGDTPTLRLEQDGSSGFTPQTWDVAGNETNFFVRDVTNGSKLSFRIQPAAPTNALFVLANGDIGLGTSSPGADLHIKGGSAESFLIDGNGARSIRFKSDNTLSVQMRLVSDLTNNRRIAAAGTDDVIDSQIQMGPSSVIIAGTDLTAPNTWATISASGITTQGPDCGTPCDGVFDPAVYEVESIEDHAAFMWENKYLWGVGPTGPEHPFNVTEKTAGILHELEKAHIYIEQLNAELKAQGAELEALKALVVK